MVSDDILDHVYLHELSHIERAWPQIEDGSYKLPCAHAETAAHALEEIDTDMANSERPGPFPPHVRKEFIETLHRGLIVQLTSQPVDIRIELSIHDRYLEHHPMQRKYLLDEIRQFRGIAAPESREKLSSSPATGAGNAAAIDSTTLSFCRPMMSTG